MPTSRATPFDLVFEPLAEERFPPIQSALEAAGQDPRDRDGFLMIRDVVELVRDLRPDEGVGEGIGELVAFLHHAYLFWAAGTPTFAATAGELTSVLHAPASEPAESAASRGRGPLPVSFPFQARRSYNSSASCAAPS